MRFKFLFLSLLVLSFLTVFVTAQNSFDDCSVYGICEPTVKASTFTNNTYNNITIVNGSSYNATYDATTNQWNTNHTTYSKFWYNMTTDFANWVAGFLYNYNQTTPSGQEVDPYSIHTDHLNYSFFNYTNGVLQWIGSIGAGTPSGSDTEIQFNDGGSFGGANITYNKTSNLIGFYREYFFPSTDGSSNQVLVTDGAGTLSWATQSGTGGGGSTGLVQGAISRNELKWVSATRVNLTAGSASVANESLSWTSDLTWAGSAGTNPLNAVRVVYVYLYNNSGTPTIEANATVPYWNATYDGYYKTGQNNKRYVGYFRTWSDAGTIKIMKFYTINLGTDGRTVEEYIISESNDVTLTNFIISQSITSTTTWHDLTTELSTLTPKFATHIWLDSRIFHGGDGNDAVLGVDVDDLGTGIAAYNALFHVRAQQSGSGVKKTFFGRSWMPIVTDTPTLYAKMFVATGSATGELYEHGARIYR